jgi:hypothetical protein
MRMVAFRIRRLAISLLFKPLQAAGPQGLSQSGAEGMHSARVRAQLLANVIDTSVSQSASPRVHLLSSNDVAVANTACP